LRRTRSAAASTGPFADLSDRTLTGVSDDLGRDVDRVLDRAENSPP